MITLLYPFLLSYVGARKKMEVLVCGFSRSVFTDIRLSPFIPSPLFGILVHRYVEFHLDNLIFNL